MWERRSRKCRRPSPSILPGIESYLNLAFFQVRANQPDQAEINFKKAAQLGPKVMNAQFALGGFYQSVNRLAEAEQQFKHAIDVDPKDPEPRAA